MSRPMAEAAEKAPNIGAPDFDPRHVESLLSTSPTAAAAYLQAHAKRGEPAAQTLLAQLCLDGHGLPRSAEEARYWFARAAHEGQPMAMNMLGRCHENGWGGPVDNLLAAIWFKRAAEAGLDWGLYNYAHCLAHGRGVPRDPPAALATFARAVELGHGRAMHFLGQYYEHGWVVPMDRARAFDLYRRAAATGDYRGLASWASVLVEQGRPEDALPLLQKALDQAPKAYRAELLRQLQGSGEPRLQALARQTVSGTENPARS